MARQAELFEKPTKPRLKRMHVIDAGDPGIVIDGEFIARFACKRCNTETDWIEVKNTTEAKRGIACWVCNPDTSKPKTFSPW